MTHSGYYRFPAIHGDKIAFICDDDLWLAGDGGGIPRRLTANLGPVTNPAFSPDGKRLAFTGREEGPSEVYIMPAEGGEQRRLTYLGCNSVVAGWNREGTAVLFSTDYRSAFLKETWLYEIGPEGGLPERVELGPAQALAFGPGRRSVLGRYLRDPAWWKRYRGGRTGQLWVDAGGGGDYRPLIDLDGNFDRPMWVGERIYFLCDHEGVGNVYSCRPDGTDLARHTRHEEHYARNASTDGRRIVYHAGGDVFLLDPSGGDARRVEIDFKNASVQRSRKFVDTAKNLHSYDVHPEGHSVALTVRGKAFTMPNWEQAVVQLGEPDGVRYRLARWLRDGRRIVVVSDAGGEEAFEIHSIDGLAEPRKIPADVAIGRVGELEVSPAADRVAFSNHRRELIFGDLETGRFKVLDASRFAPLEGIAWSPDGRYVAYACGETSKTRSVKVADVASGDIRTVTEPGFTHWGPRFDPGGRYLYFLSNRDYNPVYDQVYFDLNFPRTTKPYLVTLRRDVPNPFVPVPRAPEEGGKDPNGEPAAGGNDPPRETAIDFDGIQDRIVPFPVDEGVYEQVWGVHDKVLFSSFPVEGSLGRTWWSSDAPPAKGKIEAYDFKRNEKSVLIDGITSFRASADAKAIIYQAGHRLRVTPASRKPNGPGPGERPSEKPGRESGWIDLGRVKVSVEPAEEWRQMFREAWRLQRDHFWTEDISGIDWQRVHERYRPLLDRVSTRSELADLIWEMQGELGTSHAYEIGGDYRKTPDYRQGFLGADLAFDPSTESYRISRILKGDTWSESEGSPLARAGVNVRTGDRIVAVGGRRVGKDATPHEVLVNQAGEEVTLTVVSGNSDAPRTVCVKTLRTELPVRYREWVEENRRRVREATGGRVGYVHIPDMGPKGYSEFHRAYLTECERDGLIVDVRFNGGGHVSQLIIEKLSRKVLGYDFPRYGTFDTYPEHTVRGPIVGITNECAGSDGDIFSHCFKAGKLGPMIGTRTWGGVIGIWPRHSLVDGGVTTQPEFSSWFIGVEWGLENYGVDPDIEVPILPQDYRRGEDPQLARAVQEAMRLLETSSPRPPKPAPRPRLPLPELRFDPQPGP